MGRRLQENMITVDFKKKNPPRISQQRSAWIGLEQILEDLIKKFNVKRGKALEFGVETGYSTIALSGFFEEVTGVDTFEGDVHAGIKDTYDTAQKYCYQYWNITLVQEDYRDFIEDNDEMYDLIHVDIVHNYKETYECGLWSAKHAPVVIFHDTESFPEVKRAVEDIAKELGKQFYNYPHYYGLGIIADENTNI